MNLGFRGLTPDLQRAQLTHARINATRYADRLLTAIETRDVCDLRICIHGGNSTSKAIFSHVTGVKLGRTNKQCHEAIRGFVGPEAWDAWHAERDAVREQERAARAKKESDANKNAILGLPVRYAPEGGGVMQVITARELIDAIIAAGYRTLTPQKRGRFTDWRLCRGTSYYVFRKKIEAEYIQERLDAVGNAAK